MTNKQFPISDKKMVRLDVLRINRAKEKDCKCHFPTYEIDLANERVSCLECGAITPHFQAIVNMGERTEEINRVHAAQMDEIRQEKAELLKLKKEINDEMLALKTFEKNMNKELSGLREKNTTSVWERLKGKG